MAGWINRTELTGSSISQNGTSSHTCTFTPATAGNFLVAIVSGAVTFTTPSGWTLLNSAVGDAGLYIFTKTASSNESSFSTTHNGSNYAIKGVIYEYFTGSSALGIGSADSGASMSNPISGPTVTGLTGTYTRFAVRANNMSSTNASASIAWTLPTISDFDAYVARNTTDGIHLSIAYDDTQTASSFTPSYIISGVALPSAGQAVAFGLVVVSPPTTIPLNWITGING